MDIQEILSKAFGIASNSKFNIKIYYNDANDNKERKEMTYLQLGTELITNHEGIKEIHIIYK